MHNGFQLTTSYELLSFGDLLDIYRLKIGFALFIMMWSTFILLKTHSANTRFRILALAYVIPLFILSAFAEALTNSFDKTNSFNALNYAVDSLNHPLVTISIVWLLIILSPFLFMTTTCYYKFKLLSSQQLDKCQTKVARAVMILMCIGGLMAFTPPLTTQIKKSTAHNSLVYLWISGVFPQTGTGQRPER